MNDVLTFWHLYLLPIQSIFYGLPAGGNLRQSDDKNLWMWSPVNLVFKNVISFKRKSLRDKSTEKMQWGKLKILLLHKWFLENQTQTLKYYTDGFKTFEWHWNWRNDHSPLKIAKKPSWLHDIMHYEKTWRKLQRLKRHNIYYLRKIIQKIL